MKLNSLTAVEICAGAGGQSSGLEQAGFDHLLAVEIDADAAATLRLNRPEWNVHEGDVRDVSGFQLGDVDLFAGGVPCPPFSVAGKQLGADDERDLFPEALRLIDEIQPKAVMLENVRGLASARFDDYRAGILQKLSAMGYVSEWRVVYASWFGVPQLRPRFILIALKEQYATHFAWPVPVQELVAVGDALYDLMAKEGWSGAGEWALKANAIAPTIVGGSKKHGGADLGPTRAKQAWLELGVDAKGVADAPPSADTPADATPRLTNAMVARIQGFPVDWQFAGRKTSVYRQIGNAFPAPVARALGEAIADAIRLGDGFNEADPGLALERAVA